MMLSAVDCLRRGAASVRANWELVALQWVGLCLFAALLAAGLLLPLVVLGFDLLARGLGWLGELGRPELASSWGWELGERILARLRASAPAVAVSLVGLLALWLLALVVRCWFQAATYGVLAAADRQAPAGADRDWRWFRTFSGRDFQGWGGHYLGRYLRFLVLVILVFLLFALLVFAWIATLALGAARWGPGAAFGIGCGGALPVFFVLLVLRVWMDLGKAALPVESARGTGVGAASHLGFEVLGRRLGAVILLFVIYVVALIAVGVFFFVVSFAVEAALHGELMALLATRLLLTLVQWIPQVVLELTLAGALVALVRSEAKSESPARSESPA